MKVLSILLVLFLASCGNNIDYSKEKGNVDALQEIKKEPLVKDVFINDANVLYVSVESDGTNRDGYAQYICEILKDKKATSMMVKIVENGSQNDKNGFGVELGKCICE